MSMEIHWRTLLPESRDWNYRHVSYAYLDPNKAQILYLGMAWRRTVRQRFRDRDKNALRDFLSDVLGIDGVKVLVGEVWMEGRLSRQLLSEVESLLIKRLKPPGNIMCRSNRISRQGMRLKCLHEWPHERTRFVDV
jgi:hypothetical protein